MVLPVPPKYSHEFDLPFPLARLKESRPSVSPQVTNTGNVDLTEVWLQHEGVIYNECPKAGSSKARLGPSESFSCNGTHTLSWLDVTAGVLDERAL